MIEIPILLLALLLGFKHSYDADHLIAVSNILRKSRSMKSSLKIGISWAAGHMLTAAVVTVLLYTFKETILQDILPHFERIVGGMLFLLGAISLKDVFITQTFHAHPHHHGKTAHAHPHQHESGSGKHAHRHMLGIGIIHGLASNDELLILFTASLGISTLSGILLGVGIFSVGVVLGMMVFSFIVTYPLLKINKESVYRTFALLSGLVGMAYGIGMLLGIT